MEFLVRQYQGIAKLHSLLSGKEKNTPGLHYTDCGGMLCVPELSLTEKHSAAGPFYRKPGKIPPINGKLRMINCNFTRTKLLIRDLCF